MKTIIEYNNNKYTFTGIHINYTCLNNIFKDDNNKLYDGTNKSFYLYSNNKNILLYKSYDVVMLVGNYVT